MNKNIDSYKKFIDAAVSIKEAAPASWIVKGAYPDIPVNEYRNKVVASFTNEQREEIAKMIQEAKESGIHDLLALISDTSDVRYKGVDLPKEPFGTDLYYDFVARSEGDSWPE
jgi:hypothetical protein